MIKTITSKLELSDSMIIHNYAVPPLRTARTNPRPIRFEVRGTPQFPYSPSCYRSFLQVLEKVIESRYVRHRGCFDELILLRIEAVLMFTVVLIAFIPQWPNKTAEAAGFCSMTLVAGILVFLGIKYLRFDLLLPFQAVALFGMIGFAFGLLFSCIEPERFPKRNERVLRIFLALGFGLCFLSEYHTRRALNILIHERRIRDVNVVIEATRHWLFPIHEASIPHLEQLPTTNLIPPPMQLPMTKLTQTQVQDSEHCVICLEDWILGERVVQLGCGHIFHSECIRITLRNISTCPVCRSKVNPNCV